MTLRKIIATYEDTEDRFRFFAEANGWKEMLLNIDGEDIPNPESLDEFISRWAKNMLKDTLGSPMNKEIEKAALEQAKRDQESFEAVVESQLNINFE